ncbi:hypothetical protein AX774_g7530 [Zancudomyces culisetae]|uniref:Peroxisomal membrane protein 11C n=1 Tax=Zancudomyces culisetae TaxID=1213189 RepID=A0A1R1PDJ2_ZANCU|nr:hypothetical protein AX774_g7530 [Zancudomyces culisetae]|eukprot:OMH79065.1 hypothetical protein AX774_g7530 [Zancudomyces culisetae]
MTSEKSKNVVVEEQKDKGKKAMKVYPAMNQRKIVLNKLVKYFTTYLGCDNILMIAQYSTRVLGWLLLKRQKKDWAQRVTKLSVMLSAHRIMARMLTLVPLYNACITGLLTPDKSRLIRATNIVQSLSMLAFYPLERMFWLIQNELIPVPVSDAPRYFLLACRFWGTWVALNFVKLFDSYREIQAKRSKVLSNASLDAEEVQEELVVLKAREATWKRALISNAAFFPLTLHWSSVGVVVPDVAIGIAGTVAGICNFINNWNALSL